jgi:hypothetical protein
LAFRVGTIGYTFLFEENGRLLYHAYDDGVLSLPNSRARIALSPSAEGGGFVDLDEDGDIEKVTAAPLLPNMARPSENADNPRSNVLMIHDISPGKCVLMFSVRYDRFWNGEIINARLEGPKLVLYRGLDSKDIVAEFAWNDAKRGFDAPPGGHDCPWDASASGDTITLSGDGDAKQE